LLQCLTNTLGFFPLFVTPSTTINCSDFFVVSGPAEDTLRAAGKHCL